MGDIPNQVQVVPAPGVEGDFCDSNPRSSYDAGPLGLVAGPNGCVIGRFAWATNPADADGAPGTVSNTGAGLPSGFVHREQQGLNTAFLSAFGMTIPKGYGVTLMTSGGFWVKNNGATQALYGMKAYANLADGGVTFDVTGQSTAGGTSTASDIAAGTNSFVGYIIGDQLTVTGSVVGVIYPGTTLSGTGVVSGTKVSVQISGTVGGAGVYAVSIPEQNVAPGTAISGTYGILTVAGTVVAGYAVGQAVSGGTISATTTITASKTSIPTSALTGVGAAGTYIVDVNTVVSSAAINTVSTKVETKYIARSSGLPGEIVKMSNFTNA